MKVFAFSGFLGSEADWTDLVTECRDFQIIPLVPVPAAPVGADQNGWDAFCEEFISNQLTRYLNPGEKCFLLGYSLGGRAAANLVVRHPQFFTGLLALSAHPGLSSQEERSARLQQDAKWSMRFHPDSKEPWAQLMTDWDSQSVFASDTKRLIPVETLELRKRSALQLAHLSLGHQRDLSKDLILSKVPQIWVTGSLDTKFSGLASQLSTRSNGKILHIAVEGQGHRWPWTMSKNQSKNQSKNDPAQLIHQSLLKLKTMGETT